MEELNIKALKKMADKKTVKRMRELEDRMTTKQLRFAQFYIINPNAAAAARNAKYSEKTAKVIGKENLTKPYLREYIELFMKIQDDSRVATAQEVLQTITKVMRGEMIIESTILKTDGKKTQEITVKKNKASHEAIIRAANTLGQFHRLWQESGANMLEATIEITIDGEKYGEGEEE